MNFWGENKLTETLQMQTFVFFFPPFPKDIIVVVSIYITLHDEPKHTVLFQTTGQTVSIVLVKHSDTRTEGMHRRCKETNYYQEDPRKP